MASPPPPDNGERETRLLTARLIRRACLALIAFDLALIGGALLRYPALLAQPGAGTYLLEAIVPFGCYAAAIALLRGASSFPTGRLALRSGTVLGLLSGALWVINLALETFSDLADHVGLLATAPFFLGAFALWGMAGLTGARRTGTIGLGILAAVWAAMVCALLTVTFGLALTHTSLPRLEHNLAADPDFLRSQWQDLRAFAYANSFAAAFSHLLIAPVIGAIVGIFGSCAGVGWHRVRGAHPRRSAGDAS